MSAPFQPGEAAMRTFQEIKDNYRFTDPDIETLKGLLPVV